MHIHLREYHTQYPFPPFEGGVRLRQMGSPPTSAPSTGGDRPPPVEEFIASIKKRFGYRYVRDYYNCNKFTLMTRRQAKEMWIAEAEWQRAVHFQSLLQCASFWALSVIKVESSPPDARRKAVFMTGHPREADFAVPGDFGVLLPEVLFLFPVRHLQGRLKNSRLGLGSPEWSVQLSDFTLRIKIPGGDIQVLDFRGEILRWNNDKLGRMGTKYLMDEIIAFLMYIDNEGHHKREALTTNAVAEFLCVNLDED